MSISYQAMRFDMHVQETIDRYMSNGREVPVGMLMQVPLLDINATADAQLAMEYATYRFSGIASDGYRGWARIN